MATENTGRRVKSREYILWLSHRRAGGSQRTSCRDVTLSSRSLDKQTGPSTLPQMLYQCHRWNRQILPNVKCRCKARTPHSDRNTANTAMSILVCYLGGSKGKVAQKLTGVTRGGHWECRDGLAGWTPLSTPSV